MLVGLGVTDIIRCCYGSFRDVIGVRLHVGCMIWFDYLYLGGNVMPSDYPTYRRTLFYSILSKNHILYTWLNMVWVHPNHIL